MLVLAVLVLLPVTWILLSLLRLQAASLGVDQAVRQAVRALDAAPSVGIGMERARLVAGVALQDQGIGTDGMVVSVVPVGAGCAAPPVVPSLRPGAVYDVCVRATVTLPGVPSMLSGTANTATGVLTWHVGELREGR
ncbi:hypothetical protein [Nakamurella alba]|uniref:hypothetical protein n=1 Tax=Nakamurella alba TaxID=2665158 RepID=UPI0018AA9C43|nr:hypothetical protein [Nakamurella alba]